MKTNKMIVANMFKNSALNFFIERTEKTAILYDTELYRPCALLHTMKQIEITNTNTRRL